MISKPYSVVRKIENKEGPKYIASQELDRKSAFFNITADPDPKDIVVVEGEFDALKATAEGIENVVAIGGAEIGKAGVIGPERMDYDKGVSVLHYIQKVFNGGEDEKERSNGEIRERK